MSAGLSCGSSGEVWGEELVISPKRFLKQSQAAPPCPDRTMFGAVTEFNGSAYISVGGPRNFGQSCEQNCELLEEARCPKVRKELKLAWVDNFRFNF